MNLFLFSLTSTSVSFSVDFSNSLFVLLSQKYPDLYLIILELIIYIIYLFSKFYGMSLDEI